MMLANDICIGNRWKNIEKLRGLQMMFSRLRQYIEAGASTFDEIGESLCKNDMNVG